jgi:YCII-related domain-containing protein
MYYFVKTQNPRPTFHLDMTASEREIMNRHVAYWSDFAARGVAIVFGPVMDPAGVYGIGVYEVQDEAEMRALLDHDPANGLLRYDVFLMPRAVVGLAARSGAASGASSPSSAPTE